MDNDIKEMPAPSIQDTGKDDGKELSLIQQEKQPNLVEKDSNDAIAFLKQYSNRFWVLSAINLEKTSLITKTFLPDQEHEMFDWIESYNGVRNLYFHVNSTKEPLSKKAERTDIKALDWLHVDIDPRPGEDIEEEQNRALAMLQNPPAGLPKPTVIIFSGGGYQGFWKLTESLDIDGDLAKAEDAKLFNKHLENVFGADNCHNIDRIMRLPGTINIPDDKKLKKGRKPALAKLVEFDASRVYRLGENGLVKAKNKPNYSCAVEITLSTNIPTVTIDDLPPEVSDKIKSLIIHGKYPDEPNRYSSRSEPLFAVCCALARCKVHHDLILSIITNPNFGISASVLDKKSNSSKYAKRQIEKAIAATTSVFNVDKDGKPCANDQHNIRTALKQLNIDVSYDKFHDRLIVQGLDKFGPLLDDNGMTRLWLLIDERYHFRPRKEFFWSVVQDYAIQNSFHPVLDYLNSLEWDGIHRIDSWLSKYGGTEDNEYTRVVGALMLIAAVRRIRKPGCKFDEMLVLESDQGTNKSSALKVLAVNEDWFTDDIPLNADSKRVIEALAGRWIVEAAELKGMRKGDVEHLKAFLARQCDRGRLAYARIGTEVPRQCVFFGTTNSSQYLRDGTGNRRFWPVKVKLFDLALLKQDIDQLWAEASHREAQDDSIRLAEELWSVAAIEQEKRAVEDPYFLMLEEALDGKLGKIKASDVWNIIGITPERRDQNHNSRIGEAMKRLGWQHTKLRFGKPSPENCYARGTKEERATRLKISNQGGNIIVEADIQDLF